MACLGGAEPVDLDVLYLVRCVSSENNPPMVPVFEDALFDRYELSAYAGLPEHTEWQGI
ncbi:MAG: hypothetical protein Q9208_007941 [Pyrenodesmia sp. 3 TL-2023]